MLLDIVFVVIGIGLLYWGGELLVDHSIAMAKSFGVSPMVIGLTVVAFATSAPELAATLTASFKGAPALAVGNAFGSNVANLGLILAIASLVMPLEVTSRFLRREGAFMIFATIIVYPLMADLRLDRWEGAVMVLLLAAFLRWLIRNAKRHPEDAALTEDLEGSEGEPLWKSGLGVVFGLALLVGGANVLVHGATEIARALDVPERVIGLTLVALGTSLPELAASVAAARRGEGGLVLGNVVGSNIFNLLCILGFTSLAFPIDVPKAAMGLDFWLMLGISVLTLIFLTIGKRLNRAEGTVLLMIYVGYSIYLFLPPGTFGG